MPLKPLEEPTSLWGKLVGQYTGWVMFVGLYLYLLPANLFQFLSLGIRPFSYELFRKINRRFEIMWWHWCVGFCVRHSGINVIYHGDDPPKGERALILCNHQEMADLPIFFHFAIRQGIVGDVDAITKDTIKYAPGLGWAMLFLNYTFVKRNWESDKPQFEKMFARVRRYNFPLSFLDYPEGGRLSERKLASGRAFAEKNGLTPLEHLATPKTTGFIHLVENMRERLDAVYDMTIAYVGGVPTAWQLTKGLVDDIHVIIRRFEIDELPTEKDELANWLYKTFEQKDAMLDHYYKTGEIKPPSEPLKV